MKNPLPLALACVAVAAASPMGQQSNGITIQVCSPTCVTVQGGITIQVRPGAATPVTGQPVVTVTSTGTTTPPVTVPPVTVPPVTIPPVNTQGWTGPQTAPMTAMALGQNALMNGFLPFCPSPTHCSVIYKDISAEPVATQDNTFFQAAYGSNGLSPNFQDPSATLPWYTLDPNGTAQAVFLPAHSSDIPTESDDTIIPIVCDGSMIQEGGGNPCVPWTGDGRDRHLSVIARDLVRNTLFDYETYQLETRNGVLDEYSSTIFDLNKTIEEQSTGGYTSADAAGMPQLAMGVTYEDLAAGEIKHVMRMTTLYSSVGFYDRDTYGLYASPATHAAPTGGTGRVSYMGEWLRIKASTPVPASCGPQGTVIFNAGKKHGFMVTDNGRTGLFQGTYDSRINQSDVNCLAQVHVSDMEVITVGNTKVVAGELNPETLSAGQTVAYDQTGFYTASSGRQGTLVSGTPPAPTATCTASATTLPLGSAVTFTIAATNSTKAWIDNAYGVISGNGGTITYTPTQTNSYTAKVRGSNGYVYAPCGTVTLTGPTVATPTLSPTSGTYTSAQTVSMADATAGSTIYYTTDGSTPSAGSAVYSAPFTLSTPTNVSALAMKSGFLNSPVATASYRVNIPGAVPSILGNANTGNLADGASRSVNYTFAGGTSAVLAMMYTNATTLPTSVTCGSANATLVGSIATTGGSPNYTEAVYFIQSAPSGATTCTATWASSAYATLAVTEVSGTSGFESSIGTSNAVTYPQFSCGSVTTTGTNRLILAAGNMIYSSVTPSSGYTAVYASQQHAMESVSAASASTVSPTFQSNNGNAASCVAFALKP